MRAVTSGRIESDFRKKRRKLNETNRMNKRSSNQFEIKSITRIIRTKFLINIDIKNENVKCEISTHPEDTDGGVDMVLSLFGFGCVTQPGRGANF